MSSWIDKGWSFTRRWARAGFLFMRHEVREDWAFSMDWISGRVPVGGWVRRHPWLVVLGGLAALAALAAGYVAGWAAFDWSGLWVLDQTTGTNRTSAAQPLIGALGVAATVFAIAAGVAELDMIFPAQTLEFDTTVTPVDQWPPPSFSQQFVAVLHMRCGSAMIQSPWQIEVRYCDSAGSVIADPPGGVFAGDNLSDRGVLFPGQETTLRASATRRAIEATGLQAEVRWFTERTQTDWQRIPFDLNKPSTPWTDPVIT